MASNEPARPGWDFREPASKVQLLGVLRREMDEMFELVSDPVTWEAPTACEHWQVRDVIGHLVDTTEGYLPAFDMAYGGSSAPAPFGLRVMAELVDENARSLRKVTRPDLIERLREDGERALTIFDSLSDNEWTNLMVPHPFMGPLPAMFYPEFQLVDYAVHGWDIREGTGRPHCLDGDSADLLAPVIFVLWQATADVSGVDGPFSVGIRVSGRNGGDTRADVSPDGVTFTPGSIDECPAILEFDPATLVLAGYARLRGGTVRGDRELASRFLDLFFPI